MGELEIEGDDQYLGYLKRHLQKEHPKTKGKIKIEGRLKKMKNGRVTYRKTMKNGYYDVCVGGVPMYPNVKGVVEAKMKANRVRKKQGKDYIKSKVKKMLRN